MSISLRHSGSKQTSAQLDHYQYIGYGFEALGLFKEIDQPIQAAFILMDAYFSVVRSENLKVAPARFVVPGPKALEVTGVHPSDLRDPERLSEFDAACKASERIRNKYNKRRI